MLRWKIEDVSGCIITFNLHGYHIPNAEVRLLSPQVLLSTYGGHTKQTTRKVEVCLADGVILIAHLCPRSRLPLLPFVPNIQDCPCFWTETFSYSVSNVSEIKTILGLANINLTSAQKEMLLWHQRPSHANMTWIKTLMCDRKWLVDGNSMASLHSGPFIVSKYHIPDCDVQSLKCLACLCAKATSRTTKLKSSTIKPTKNNVLK